MTTLTLREKQRAWRLFLEEGQSPAHIASVLEKPLSLVIEATVEREGSIVTFFKASRNLTLTARAVAVGKEAVVKVIEKHGLSAPAKAPHKPRPPKIEMAPVRAIDAPKTAKDLLDLEVGQCRYPFGEHAPFLFCAELTDDDVYCPHHRKLCSTPPRTEVVVTAKQAA